MKSILAAVVLLSTAKAQAPVLRLETWDTPPTVASVRTAGAWYPDRYPPAVFERFNFDGQNFLRVGIRAEDAASRRPVSARSTFHNTHGRKFDLGAGNSSGSALVADLYVGSDWNVNHRMATVWSTACDSTGGTVFYNILGFRNATGTDPGFYVYGYRNNGAYTLLPVPITYGRWYSLKIELTDTAFIYSIDGVVALSDTTLNGAKYFNDIMLQAYSFADSTLPVSNQAFDEYDVYWDNVGSLKRPAVFPNPAAVDLQTAGTYRVLAGSAVTIGGGTNVGGDVGVSPGTSVTNGGIVTGNIHVNDAGAVQAQSDLATAYGDAAGRTADATAGTELGGVTLGRGVYVSEAGTFGITGTLTLTGTAADIFVFRMATTLTTGASSRVVLEGGVLASNVIWQVGSSATIAGEFAGTIMALTAITQVSGGSINGRALARTGFVTLNGVTTSPVIDEGANGPLGYALFQNYPNPFNPATSISFRLPSASMVSLTIFDALGRVVTCVLAEELPAGLHARRWDASAMPSGVYFYQLKTGAYQETRSLLLLR